MIVKRELPIAVPAFLVSVMVDEPFPGEPMVWGLKLAVTPAGNPETERAIGELNPPTVAVVTLSTPFVVELTVTLLAPGDSEKVGTFTETTCLSVMPLPAAMSVIE